MVAEVKINPTIREIAHGIGITSAALIRHIKSHSEINTMREEWIADEELLTEEMDAIINSLSVKEVCSNLNLRHYLISKYAPKHLENWQTLGHAIANIKYLFSVALKRATEGFVDRSCEYEKFIEEHKRYDLEDLSLDLKYGRLPNSKKISFLESELYEITRQTKHIDDYIKILNYFRLQEKASIEEELTDAGSKIRVLGLLLSLATFFTFALAGWVGIVEATNKLCHPNGDMKVYRDSAYCVRLKSVEEFFVGKGGLK